MDKRSKLVLKKIRRKTVEELREDEIGFLRARKTYLNLDDKDKFKSVLIEKKSRAPKKSKKSKK